MNQKDILETDLYLMFQSLDESELRNLSRFVRSPYFNQREDVVLLFNYLRTNSPKTNATRYLSKASVFGAIYENETFDEKKLHYLLSFLLKTIHKYLIIKDLEHDEIDEQIRLCKQLRQKHLTVYFRKELKKGENLLEQQPLRNAKYHRQKAILWGEYYEMESLLKREADVKLQEWSNELFYISIINTLRQACLVRSHQRVVNREYNIPLIEETMQYIEKHDFSNFQPILIYYHVYKMLNAPKTHEDFNIAQTLLLENWTLFSPPELRDITIYGINYCQQAIRYDAKFRHEGLKLYKFALERGVLFENNQLPAYSYRNIVTLAVGVKDFEWVFDFIQRYKEHLPSDKQESFYTFCLANYYFRTGNYDTAQRLLSQVELKDTLLNFDAKRLLMMMYFENKAFDALDALLTSFKSYVTNQKNVSEQHKSLNINMISIIKKMINSNINDKQTKITLKKEIENTAIIAEKDWLLQWVN